MSQSHRPTSAPERSRAAARLAATVDLPTPPFPLATAITWLTPAIFVVVLFCAAEATSGGLVMSITILVERTPGIVLRACSDSFFRVWATDGLLVATLRRTSRSDPAILISLTKPKLTISRLYPGNLTAFRRSRTSSSVRCDIMIVATLIRSGSWSNAPRQTDEWVGMVSKRSACLLLQGSRFLGGKTGRFADHADPCLPSVLSLKYLVF